jgi:hypothetical protein
MAQKTYYNPYLTNITDEFTRNEVKLGVGSIACANVPEYVPRFDKAPCETVYKGGHNSFIVLGRDRDQSWLSGRGGEGMTGCGMIDIVVGRAQSIAAHNINERKPPYEDLREIGPSFGSDAARIYLTQASQDIDKYFAIKTGGGPSAAGKSAAGIKADQVRVIGREKVAIYAGGGGFEGFGSDGETNCLGTPIENPRIELITNREAQLEPMVLGIKLINYLKEENKLVRDMLKQIFQLHVNLAMISGGLTVLPGFATVTVPVLKESTIGAVDQVMGSFNTYLKELQQLDRDIPGDGFLLSRTCFLSK